MKKVLLLSAVASAMLMAGGDIVPAPVEEAAPAPAEFMIFNNIYAKGEIRPRYEYANNYQNGVPNADAYTNRLKLGIGADLMQIDGLSVYLEGINVAGGGDYNGLSWDDAAPYDVVADPDQTRITQAYIDYKFGDTLIRAGRQGVNLDNQRFVGTVNWRQMPQTYDAVAVINNSIENLDLLGAYIWQVNTIFQDGANKRSRFDTGSVILHAAYHFMPELTLTGYGYLLENIHDTYGIAATGKIGTDFGKINYRAEYATQTDPSMTDNDPSKLFGNANASADADYYNIQATLNTNGFLLGAQYEVLSGTNGTDGKTAFTTPLATLHAHNGWADVFLGTPSTGLIDLNGMIGYNAGEYGLFKAIYHDFSSDVGSTDYGTEWDLLYKNKVPGVKNLSFLAKAAWYDAEADLPSGSNPKVWENDATKFWVMFDYTFSSK